MGLLRSWLLLAITSGPAWSTTSNKVAEVDLMFPRNESFSPSHLMPIVFAVQNPNLLSSLRPILSYRVSQLNVSPLDRIRKGDLIRLFEHNLTDVADPYLLYWSIDLAVEGTFKFTWQLTLDNCSYNADIDKIDGHVFGGQLMQFSFSTKQGAAPPDLVAFAEEETCNRTLAQAVHVPSALELPPTRTAGWGGPSCAVNPDLSPTPSPCNIKIDSAAAASISASLTVAACNNWFRTGVSCPTPSSENAASMPRFPVTRAWILAVGTWLAYNIA